MPLEKIFHSYSFGVTRHRNVGRKLSSRLDQSHKKKRIPSFHARAVTGIFRAGQSQAIYSSR